jgi:hypothetical protein
LGADGRNNQGSAWAGTFGVGFVGLWGQTPTISHPDGSVLYGRACIVCYGPPGSIIEGCIQIDGGTLVGFGKLYFNNQVFTLFCFDWNSSYYGRLAAGTHSITVGIYCEAGQVIFDGNCGGTTLIEEVPS